MNQSQLSHILFIFLKFTIHIFELIYLKIIWRYIEISLLFEVVQNQIVNHLQVVC